MHVAPDTVARVLALYPHGECSVCLGRMRRPHETVDMPKLISIQSGGLHACPVAAAIVISARSGTVWVTRAGDLRDHVVKTGQSVHLVGNGRVVVQALGGGACIALTTGQNLPADTTSLTWC